MGSTPVFQPYVFRRAIQILDEIFLDDVPQESVQYTGYPIDRKLQRYEHVLIVHTHNQFHLKQHSLKFGQESCDTYARYNCCAVKLVQCVGPSTHTQNPRPSTLHPLSLGGF